MEIFMGGILYFDVNELLHLSYDNIFIVNDRINNFLAYFFVISTCKFRKQNSQKWDGTSYRASYKVSSKVYYEIFDGLHVPYE